MFWTRLMSGVALIVIAALAFFIGAPVLPIVLLFTSLVGYRELAKALGVSAAEKAFSAPELVAYAGIIVYYGIILLADMNVIERDIILFLACIVVLFLAELFVYVFTFPRFTAERIAFAVFSFLYAPVMLSFVDFTRMLESGIFLVWLVLICSWGCDTCAYCVGMLIGKKKIFPVLSPKKSLEGCIGGVVGAALLGVLAAAVYNRASGAAALTFGNMAGIAFICGVGAVMSMVGDLAASAIKRNRGIKDYGKLIPGHGGIMDRFDSVIVTAPMVYFLSEFIQTAGVI